MHVDDSSEHQLKRLGTEEVEVHRDIESMEPPSVMQALEEVFLNHPTESTILNTIWQAMLLIDMFSKQDESYLHKLILDDDALEPFINAFVKFQISVSQKSHGSIWLGGLKGEPKSLSDEIINRSVPEGLDWMYVSNRRFEEILYG